MTRSQTITRPLPTLARAALLLLCVGILSSCGGDSGASMQRPPVPVTLASVEKQSVPVYEEAIGVTTALQAVNIVPQVSGKITEVHFMQGADVKKGDLLFVIDPRPYHAALDDAQAKVVKDEADLALNEETLKRYLGLEAANYVSTQEIDAMRAKVRASRASVEAGKATAQTARINLEYCWIRSPIDGVAGKYLVDAGNVVSSFSPQPLVTIQHMNELYVDFTLPEKDLLAVKRALQDKGFLDVEVTAITNAEVKGGAKLRYIDNQVASGSGTISFRAVLENVARNFWPGQSVRVKVVLKQLTDALLIPFVAVQYGQQGPFVFTVSAQNTADMKVVEPGQRQGDNIVITKGLEEGVKVVTSGHLMLAPGAQVMTPEQMKQMMTAQAAGGKQGHQ